jgi:hypothetical protein
MMSYLFHVVLPEALSSAPRHIAGPWRLGPERRRISRVETARSTGSICQEMAGIGLGKFAHSQWR